MTHAQTGAAAVAEVSLEQQVRSRIDSLSYLPTTVAVAMKFVELGKDPDAEPADYARVISSDSSLSSKLLSLANSSWFGVRNKVTKPQTAVNLLGLGTVRTLAISYCLTGLHNDLKLKPEESRMFWMASLCKAVAAKQYALQFDPKAGEEAFTAGLFQDFSMAILYATAREQVGRLLQDLSLDGQARLQRERELFRLDHAEMGRVVAQKIELPDVYVDAIAFHHNRQQLSEMVGKTVLAEAVHVASLFPHSLEAWNAADAEALRTFLREHPAKDGRGPDDLMAAIQQEFNRIFAFFEDADQPQVDLAALLAGTAREAADNTTRLVGTVHELLQQAASTGRQVHQILKQHSDLEEAVHRDPLTSALNREGLAVRATELLANARRYKLPVAMVYFDVDRFKGINDTCGHACGDVALQQVVRIMQESVRQTDLVARLGGDEFVVVLTDCSESDAVSVVERILAKMASQPVSDGHGHVAPATLSAGFLWVQTDAGAEGLDELIGRADKLMYQAKQAGGNRICRSAA